VIAANSKLLTVGLTTAAYVVLFELNSLLFSNFSFSTNADWIYLPSGLRLVFVLIFGVWGALGIALASITTNLIHYPSGGLFTLVVAGFISGLSPLLARKICVDKFALDKTLRNLTPKKLLETAGIFAVLSATIHQLWLTFRGRTDNFVDSVAATAVGDFLGTILVLYAARYLISRLPIFKENLKRSQLK
jgi:uncharacterized membrane-anchored protein